MPVGNALVPDAIAARKLMRSCCRWMHRYEKSVICRFRSVNRSLDWLPPSLERGVRCVLRVASDFYALDVKVKAPKHTARELVYCLSAPATTATSHWHSCHAPSTDHRRTYETRRCLPTRNGQLPKSRRTTIPAWL